MIRYLDLTSDTICAPITGSGRAGVSVVRVSGAKTLSIISKCIDKAPSWGSHRVYLRDFSFEGKKIDQVLLTYFKEGQSFTGDEVLEISCHGNPLLVQKIIEALISGGCRMAEPGEFTFRAFYNGKIDLIQAESINNMIMSTNAKASHNQFGLLEGKLSLKITGIERLLIRILAELEASIDFSEEDLGFTPSAQFQRELAMASQELYDLASTYSTGKSLDKGHKVLLLGATNVGKSSLFNAFSGEDRAIVTDTPGTTRDLLRGQVFVGPYPIEFVDSAGLRESSDEIEQIGIAKGQKEMERADLILYVVDALNPDWSKLEELPSDRTLLVVNKIDGLDEGDPKSTIQEQARQKSRELKAGFLCVSAKTGYYIDKLSESIENHFASQETGSEDSVLITQARQVRHLQSAVDSLQEAALLLEQVESPDIISQVIQTALGDIHYLMGKKYDDEILDQIFSQFCIGK